MIEQLFNNKRTDHEFIHQIRLMKTALSYSLILLSIAFLSKSAYSQGWDQIDDFPSTARDDGTSFTIGSIAYCGTGLNASWNPTNDFYAFDMTSESWSPISNLPINEVRQYSNGFSSNSHGFLFGGLNSNGYLNDLWKYDPTIDTWTEVSPMPSVGRSGAACFSIGDTAYIIGGQTQSNSAISEVWAYSMSTDSWTQKSPFPDSIWRASAISHQGKGYLVFGANNEGIYSNELYEYEPITDTWIQLSNFPGVGRTYSGISLLDDQITIISGRDSIGNSYNDMWQYSFASGNWNLSVNLPSDQRRGGICFSSSAAIYYTTGINLHDVRLTQTWKYDLFLSSQTHTLDEFTIYPNPAKDFIMIKGFNTEGSLHYQISSINGTVIQSGKTDDQKTIQLDSIKKGYYLITIQYESRRITKKILIL